MHSYIFCCLPIISLYFKNHLEFSLPHILGVIFIFCVVNGILYGGLSLIFKKYRVHIQLLLSCWWLLFWFAIPVARSILGGASIPSFIVAYKWFFAVVVCTITLAVLVSLLCFVKKLSQVLNHLLSVFAIISLCIVALGGLTQLKTIPSKHSKTIATTDLNHKQPNVYHIILDAYTNYDVLKKEYNYDNINFYSALESLGFVCYPSSYSNYPGTVFSMSSVLNLGLVHERFYPTAPLAPSLQYELMDKMNNNLVWPCFEQKGYKAQLLEHTTIYKSSWMPKNEIKVDNFSKTFLSLIQKTLLKELFLDIFLGAYYENHAKEIKTILSKLQQSPQCYGYNNQYIYAHILSPHEPFVFDENANLSKEQTFQGFLVQKQTNVVGTPEEKAAYQQKYVNQIKAINNLTLPVIESILKQHPADQQPIIILHGDHGRLSSGNEDPFNALANLFAIYVPPEWREEAKDLEFINLYRFICNHLFNLKYPYQESQYFYSGKIGN
jgi:hypothetical protein